MRPNGRSATGRTIAAATAVVLACTLLAPAPATAAPDDEVRLQVRGHRIRDRCTNEFEFVRGDRAVLTVRTDAPRAVFLLQRRRDGDWQTIEHVRASVTDGTARWAMPVTWTGVRRAVATIPGTGSRLAIRSTARILRGVEPTWHTYADGGIRLRVPYHRQQHRLSCESATLRMAHNAFRPGRIDRDRQVMRVFGVDRRRPAVHNGCNPNRKFCGDVNGSMMTTGYGVHHRPIARAATHFAPCRPGKALTGYRNAQIARALADGFPVIVWGAHRGRTGIHRYTWRAHDGERIVAYSVQHTWTVFGFRGPASNPTHYVVHDPSGKRNWMLSRATFNRFTQYYRTAVIVRG